MPHHPDHEHAKRTAKRFDEHVLAQQAANAALVEALGASVTPALFGQHSRRSLEQMVRDSGFGDAGALVPVLRINGKPYAAP